MKTILLIISGILISIITYSQNQSLEILEDDKLIKKYFTKSDIKELNKILSFFDQITQQNCDEKATIENCYKNYCKNLFEKAGLGKMNLGFSFEKEREMLDDLKLNTFNKIWYYTKSFQRVNGKLVETSIAIELSYKSKYMELCRDIAIENPDIKFYYDSFQSQGSLNSDIVSGVLMHYDQFNFKEIRERLLIAIHYLTVNSRSFK